MAAIICIAEASWRMADWEIISPPAKTGRLPMWSMREVVSAIFYGLRARLRVADAASPKVFPPMTKVSWPKVGTAGLECATTFKRRLNGSLVRSLPQE